MVDIKNKQALDFDDLSALDAVSSVKWIPREPRELILPYTSTEEETEETEIDKKRRIAKEVYDGYTELSKKCAVLKQEIEDTCKTVEVTLDLSTQLNVSDAVKRVFGTNGQKITFTMYKKAIEKLNELSNNNTAKV